MVGMGTVARRSLPATSTLLARAAALRCPLCGYRPLFRRWTTMLSDCPSCGLHFERVVGHWFGSLAVNTVVCMAAIIGVIMVGFLLSYPTAPETPWYVAAIGIAVVLPVAGFPWSRTFWTALDLRLRPLTDAEAPAYPG